MRYKKSGRISIYSVLGSGPCGPRLLQVAMESMRPDALSSCHGSWISQSPTVRHASLTPVWAHSSPTLPRSLRSHSSCAYCLHVKSTKPSFGNNSLLGTSDFLPLTALNQPYQKSPDKMRHEIYSVVVHACEGEAAEDGGGLEHKVRLCKFMERANNI